MLPIGHPSDATHQHMFLFGSALGKLCFKEDLSMPGKPEYYDWNTNLESWSYEMGDLVIQEAFANKCLVWSFVPWTSGFRIKLSIRKLDSKDRDMMMK